MQTSARVLVFAIAIGLLATFPLAVRPASAHEHVTVGEYELTVGWRDEPAVAGYLNGLDLGIQHHFSNGTTAWVVGVEGNLTAVLSTGLKNVSKALEPQFGRDGWYTFNVIPTRVGTYHVRITGTLGSTPVDATVKLDDVSPASDLAFPAGDPQTQLDAANAAIAGLQAQLTLALIVAFLSILVAAVGLAMGWRMSRGPKKGP
jgi:hypothetical protein